MSQHSSASDPVVIIVAACQPPGKAIAKAFAQSGTRVIVIDRDAKGLTRIAAQQPDMIETLALERLSATGTAQLGAAWGDVPLDMVINLTPLARPFEIRPHLRRLKTIFRCTGKGLAATQGSVISVVAQPHDLLALNQQGLLGALRAASAALGQVFAAQSVRVHVLSVPRATPEVVVPVLLRMIRPVARQIPSGSFDLKPPKPTD